MSDVADMVHMAHIFHRLREPVLRSALQVLQLPAGSRGLDAGCGTGLQALLLAREVGPRGHVTGVDLSAEALAQASEMVKEAGLSQRIAFREGDVRQLPFEDDTFDWTWSVDCVGYAPLEPLPLIRQLARVVKPGGCVAILAWSSETLLPGYPQLEARLSATAAGVSPFVPGTEPASHFLRALGWFREAGLLECKAHTFAASVHAPLSDEHRSALEALFAMRWPGVESELGPQDWAEFQRLCIPGSPDFVLDCLDYCAFFTYSMFCGKVPG